MIPLGYVGLAVATTGLWRKADPFSLLAVAASVVLPDAGGVPPGVGKRGCFVTLVRASADSLSGSAAREAYEFHGIPARFAVAAPTTQEAAAAFADWWDRAADLLVQRYGDTPRLRLAVAGRAFTKRALLDAANVGSDAGDLPALSPSSFFMSVLSPFSFLPLSTALDVCEVGGEVLGAKTQRGGVRKLPLGESFPSLAPRGAIYGPLEVSACAGRENGAWAAWQAYRVASIAWGILGRRGAGERGEREEVKQQASLPGFRPTQAEAEPDWYDGAAGAADGAASNDANDEDFNL